jgi:two-component system, NarL family, response regulator
MKLMIVEDNAEMRRLIISLVGDLASTVCECTDGAEALAAYERFHPDWVLMDIKMKQMDGLEATREIHACAPEAKIMIVTDYDQAELREAAREAGAREYVVKDDLLAIPRLLAGDT